MKQPIRTLLLVLSLCVAGAPVGMARPLLIRGGTLIDGTGKAPLQNANVLMDGNLIQRIWTGNTAPVALPADTQVIDAQGKFIIPGLIDSHVHYREYMGELFLAHGVTAVNDLGDPMSWLTAVKKGMNDGKIRGPRFYFCGSANVPTDGEAALPAIRVRDVAVVRTPEDAKSAVAILKPDSDCVKLTEFIAGDIFTAIARESRAVGLNVISHSLNAFDHAKWGINGMEHMTGIGLATIRSAEGRKAAAAMNIEAGHKNSLLYQWMEPAIFDELIQDLVRRNIYINPTLHFEWKGLTEHVRDHELEDSRLLNNPDLQYVPLSERVVFLGQYHWADSMSHADKEKALQGYRKVQEFLKRFVQAGGKIYSGTDSAAALTPGLSLHHEMQLLVDAGLTPMQALQSSTIWAAEILSLQDKLGTVEPSKFADVVILRNNPLQDIRNTKTVDTVIRGGEIMDTRFHSDYRFPFLRYGPESKHLYNPVPALTNIQPPLTPEGSEVKLRIIGQRFVSSSVVRVGELRVPTQWVSSKELLVTLSPSLTATVGTFLISVETPVPGGGRTEPLEFYVTYR
jgi:imidazolonepropionase-like amidohydrolase